MKKISEWFTEQKERKSLKKQLKIRRLRNYFPSWKAFFRYTLSIVFRKGAHQKYKRSVRQQIASLAIGALGALVLIV
jgi:hypothetical protein